MIEAHVPRSPASPYQKVRRFILWPSLHGRMQIKIFLIAGAVLVLGAGGGVWYARAAREPAHALQDAGAQFFALPAYHFEIETAITLNFSAANQDAPPARLAVHVSGDTEKTQQRTSALLTYALTAPDNTTTATGEISLKSIDETLYLLFKNPRGAHTPFQAFEGMGWIRFDARTWYESEHFQALARSMNLTIPEQKSNTARSPSQKSTAMALKALLINPKTYTVRDAPSWWQLYRKSSPLPYSFIVNKPELRQITSLLTRIIEDSSPLPVENNEYAVDYANSVTGDVWIDPRTKDITQVIMRIEPLPSLPNSPFSIGAININGAFAPAAQTLAWNAPTEPVAFEQIFTTLMNEWFAGSSFEISAPVEDNAKDTDGDGLIDYVEFMHYKTDHLNPDTDGDGYDDGTEIRNGYDPLIPFL